MVSVGIDPGKSGGIAALYDGQPMWAVPLPYATPKRLDTQALIAILEAAQPDVVGVEVQSIFKGQGGAMTIGVNFGRILACIEILDLPLRDMTPHRWRKAAGLRGKPGQTSKENKAASLAYARDRWGSAFTGLGIPASKDGLYEALLISLAAANEL